MERKASAVCLIWDAPFSFCPSGGDYVVTLGPEAIINAPYGPFVVRQTSSTWCGQDMLCNLFCVAQLELAL